MRASFIIAALAASVVSAKDIWIQVANNQTANATHVFTPNSVVAKLNDIVWFNFTEGNHTATQSAFASPCTPRHISNVTLNGFDSAFRDAGNHTSVTTLSVPITPDIENQTIWFYDHNTCGGAGVGVINANESSWETLLGYQRNAVRLNGTGAKTSSSVRPSGSKGASSSDPSGTSVPEGAASTLTVGVLAALPLAVLALVL